MWTQAMKKTDYAHIRRQGDRTLFASFLDSAVRKTEISARGEANRTAHTPEWTVFENLDSPGAQNRGRGGGGRCGIWRSPR